MNMSLNYAFGPWSSFPSSGWGKLVAVLKRFSIQDSTKGNHPKSDGVM